MNKISIEQAVAFLNDLLRIDSLAVQVLIEAEVATGPEMADHPTVQVAPQASFDRPTGLYMLRFLGLLNGLFGTADPSRVIAAVYHDDTRKLLRFEIRALANGSMQPLPSPASVSSASSATSVVNRNPA